MKHLYSNQCHDESQVWCGDDGYYLGNFVAPVNDPAQADCERCLEAAASFGVRATARIVDLYFAKTLKEKP